MFNFQAIILAAGCATRMNLTTEKIPKCLLPIGKTTILDRQIDILLKNGINDILIVTGYQSDLIKKHFLNTNIKLFIIKIIKNMIIFFQFGVLKILLKIILFVFMGI